MSKTVIAAIIGALLFGLIWQSVGLKYWRDRYNAAFLVIPQDVCDKRPNFQIKNVVAESPKGGPVLLVADIHCETEKAPEGKP